MHLKGVAGGWMVGFGERSRRWRLGTFYMEKWNVGLG